MPRLMLRQAPLDGPNDPGAHDPEAREWPDAILVQGTDPGAEHRAEVRRLNALRQQKDEEARLRHAEHTAAGQLLGSLAATAARERKRKGEPLAVIEEMARFADTRGRPHAVAWNDVEHLMKTYIPAEAPWTVGYIIRLRDGTEHVVSESEGEMLWAKQEMRERKRRDKDAPRSV